MPPADRQAAFDAEKAAAKKTASAVTPGDKPTMNVLEVLETHRRGRTLGDIQDALQELVAAVQDTKRKGAITVAISAECRTPGSAKTLDISVKVRMALPEPIREKTTYFATEQHTLQREDPTQGTLAGIIDED